MTTTGRVFTAYEPPYLADQHLTKNHGRTTLCGYEREDVRADIPFHDHAEGFIVTAPDYLPCAGCADAADILQNGHS